MAKQIKKKTVSKKTASVSKAKVRAASTAKKTKSAPKAKKKKTAKNPGVVKKSAAKESSVAKKVKTSKVVKKASKSAGKGPTATSQDPIQFPEEVRRLPKTHLKAAELREFKVLLLGKRREIVGDVQHLTDGALNKKDSGHGDHSTMPIHMADLGSDNWEQEFTLGLIASEQALVREIDEALERVLKKTYGVCLATHNPISNARLRAKPWAKYCIEYARAREEGRAS